MVKKKLLDGEWISTLPEPKNLYVIRQKSNAESLIKNICDTVIGSIERCQLVPVNTEKLIEDAEKLSKKRKKWYENEVFFPMSDEDYTAAMKSSAQLRNDWTIKSFLDGNIRGYIFYNEDKEPLGFIYVHRDRPDNEFVFLDRDIFLNKPIAANIIRELSKKYNKIWKKSHHK